MKKLLVGSLALLLTCCGYTQPVSIPFIERTLKACPNNGGIKQIQYNEFFSDIYEALISCNDGAVFTLYKGNVQ